MGKEERKKITGNIHPMDVVITMSEGNPGAITVLTMLISTPPGLMDILHLDDMGIRGPQIWVAYKDYAKGNFIVFQKSIRERNLEMVKKVNAECPDRIAVVGGAS